MKICLWILMLVCKQSEKSFSHENEKLALNATMIESENFQWECQGAIV